MHIKAWDNYRKPGTETPRSRIVASLAGAIALIMAVSGSSQGAVRKATAAKSSAAAQEGTAQQQKPVKPRYFGGPKSAMY
jgi:hypothetical protein